MLTPWSLRVSIYRIQRQEYKTMTQQESIIQAARQIISTEGSINLTRSKLCEMVGIPTGSFPHVMGCSFTDLTERLGKENIPEPIFSTKKGRADPKLRRESILSAAVECSTLKGYKNVTRADVAERAGVSAGLVTRYFNTMNQLRVAVLRWAAKNDHLPIIGQAMINGEKYVKDVNPIVKDRAIKAVMSK